MSLLSIAVSIFVLSLTAPGLAHAGFSSARIVSGVVRRLDSQFVYVQTERGVESVPRDLIPKGTRPDSEEWIKIPVSFANDARVKVLPSRAGSFRIPSGR